jgi:hypothetical protein
MATTDIVHRRDRAGSLPPNSNNYNNLYSTSWKTQNSALQNIQENSTSPTHDLDNNQNMDEGVVRTLGILGLDGLSEGTSSPKESRKTIQSEAQSPKSPISPDLRSNSPLTEDNSSNLFSSTSTKLQIGRISPMPPPLRTQRAFSIANGGTYDDVLNSADIYLSRPRAQSVSISIKSGFQEGGALSAIPTGTQTFLSAIPPGPRSSIPTQNDYRSQFFSAKDDEMAAESLTTHFAKSGIEQIHELDRDVPRSELPTQNSVKRKDYNTAINPGNSTGLVPLQEHNGKRDIQEVDFFMLNNNLIE